MIALLIPIFLVLFIISGEAVAVSEEELACTTDTVTEENLKISKLGSLLSNGEVVEFMKLQAEDDNKPHNAHLVIQAKIEKLLANAQVRNNKPTKLTKSQKQEAKSYICGYIKDHDLRGVICTDEKFVENTLKSLEYNKAIEVFRFLIEVIGKQCSESNN